MKKAIVALIVLLLIAAALTLVFRTTNDRVTAQTGKPKSTFGIMSSGVGIIVTAVEPGSPAERAGLKPNDIITYFGGKQLFSFEDLVSVTNNSEPGASVEIKYQRPDPATGGFAYYKATVTLGPAPKD